MSTLEELHCVARGTGLTIALTLGLLRCTAAAVVTPPRLAVTERGGCLVQQGSVRCWDRGDHARRAAWRATLELQGRVLALDGDADFGCAIVGQDTAELRAKGAAAGGVVYCWGANAFGQLGAGSSVMTSPRPRRPLGLRPATAIAVSEDHACAVDITGRVACWGNNAQGQCAHDTYYASEMRHRVLPRLVPGLPRARKVAVTASSSCAVTEQGVYCWGDLLQRGRASVLPRAAPTKPILLQSLAGAQQVRLTEDCGCALLVGGRVACFATHEGACQSREPRSAIDPLRGLAGVRRIGVGRRMACAEVADGTLQCWQHPFPDIGDEGPPDWRSPYLPASPLRQPRAAPFQDFGLGRDLCLRDQNGLRCWDTGVSSRFGQAPPVELPF